MRYLGWIAKLALFLLLLGLGVKNTDPVTLHYFLGYEWNAPLSLLLFIFFGTGVVLGAIAAFTLPSRRRGESKSADRPAREQSRERHPEVPPY